MSNPAYKDIIYGRIFSNIERIVGKIARQMLDSSKNDINKCIDKVSFMSQSEVKFKIWRACKLLEIFDKRDVDFYEVEEFVLKLYDDDSENEYLHSFDFKNAIINMCILLYSTNRKSLGYGTYK